MGKILILLIGIFSSLTSFAKVDRNCKASEEAIRKEYNALKEEATESINWQDKVQENISVELLRQSEKMPKPFRKGNVSDLNKVANWIREVIQSKFKSFKCESPEMQDHDDEIFINCHEDKDLLHPISLNFYITNKSHELRIQTDDHGKTSVDLFTHIEDFPFGRITTSGSSDILWSYLYPNEEKYNKNLEGIDFEGKHDDSYNFAILYKIRDPECYQQKEGTPVKPRETAWPSVRFRR